MLKSYYDHLDDNLRIHIDGIADGLLTGKFQFYAVLRILRLRTVERSLEVFKGNVLEVSRRLTMSKHTIRRIHKGKYEWPIRMYHRKNQ